MSGYFPWVALRQNQAVPVFLLSSLVPVSRMGELEKELERTQVRCYAISDERI
jgi:hypothetical protein